MPLTKVRTGGVDSIGDDKLSNNIATLNGTQTFTGVKTFNSNVALGSSARITGASIQNISSSSIGSGTISSFSAWTWSYNTAVDSGINVPAGTYIADFYAETSQYSHIDYFRTNAGFSLDGGTNYIWMDMGAGAVRGGLGNSGYGNSQYRISNHYQQEVTTTGGNYFHQLRGYGGDYNTAYYGVAGVQLYATYWNRGYVNSWTYVRLTKMST